MRALYVAPQRCSSNTCAAPAPVWPQWRCLEFQCGAVECWGCPVGLIDFLLPFDPGLSVCRIVGGKSFKGNKSSVLLLT